MKSRTTRSNNLFYAMTVLLLIAGAIFWAGDLDTDPPTYYTGLGQSLGTDPPQYIYHARNKVLYDDWDPFDYPRWTVYQHSLTSLVGYVWFSIAGVSIKQAGVVGMILTLGALAFFLLGIARHHRPWVLTAVAFCYLINVTLFTYGRLPYLECALLLWSSLLFFVYSWWGHRLWGIAACGSLIAAATLTGKLFGALLMPALLVAVFVSSRHNRWRSVVIAAVSYVGSGLLLMLLLYSGDLTAAFAYVGEQSYGLRGFPEGLSSPWGFIEHLVGYGFKNRLFYRGPDLLMFLLVSAGLLLVFRDRKEFFRNNTPVIILCSFWIAAVFLGLMPLNYSPLRYTLFLIPAVVILCFSLIDRFLQRDKSTAQVTGKTDPVLLCLAMWAALYHIVGNVMYFNHAPYRILTWATLPPAAALTAIVWWLTRRKHIAVTRPVLRGLLVLVLILSGIVNGFRIRRSHYLDHNYNLAEANEDLERILSPGAVVSGPYGPALTLNTDLKSFIHLFGVAEVDSTLFDRYPITHLAVDVSNFNEAVSNYPRLDGVEQVANYWIRDQEVRLLNISQVFDNPEANAYRESHYETAMGYYLEGKYDSAAIELDQHAAAAPLSRSSGLLKADLLARSNRAGEALTMLSGLAKAHPTDFFLQMQCGRLHMAVALATGNHSLMPLARKYFEQGIAVNKWKTDYANRLVMQTQQAYGGQKAGPAGP